VVRMSTPISSAGRPAANGRASLTDVHRSRKSGFTLLEMLVVLVLIGLLAAFALPRVGKSLPGLQLRTAARQVAATFRYAAQRAMSEQAPYAVYFDVDGASVMLAPLDTVSRVPSRSIPLDGKAPAALDQWQLPDTIQLVVPLDQYLPSNGTDYAVFFHPGGGGSGGAVRVAASSERQLEVSVDFITSETAIREVEER